MKTNGLKDEMHKDPNHSEECHKHVKTIATALPIASRRQRAHLHHHLVSGLL